MEQRRIRLKVRYDGTEFAGSQIQPGKRTVAGTLKDELEAVAGGRIRLLFAGRTDAGVHAEANVCAFDAALPFPGTQLRAVLAPRLPGDIWVRESQEAAPGFHPRFDAIRRVYVYRVYRSEDAPVDRWRYCAAYGGPWNGAAVACALEALAGTHAFHNFCQGSAPPEKCRCRLEPVAVEERGAEVAWQFAGNRFLRHMLCRVAGALLGVAAGKTSPAEFKQALDESMSFQSKPAPARGLTLLRIEYDE